MYTDVNFHTGVIHSLSVASNGLCDFPSSIYHHTSESLPCEKQSKHTTWEVAVCDTSGHLPGLAVRRATKRRLQNCRAEDKEAGTGVDYRLKSLAEAELATRPERCTWVYGRMYGNKGPSDSRKGRHQDCLHTHPNPGRHQVQHIDSLESLRDKDGNVLTRQTAQQMGRKNNVVKHESFNFATFHTSQL